MRDDPSVVALVARAAGSDERAWYELVDRYAPLVWSICARYQLSGADIEDVGQTVWLGLVEQLSNEKLREPAALPGWLATTTQRECLRVLRVRGKYEVFGTDPDSGGLNRAADIPVIDATEIEEEILQTERNALLRAALAELPESDQRLLTLLLRDPPLSYVEIGDILDMPPGSIGPTRQRCLRRLSRSPLLAGLSDLAPPAAGSGPGKPGPGVGTTGTGGRTARAGPREETSRTGSSQTGLSGPGAGTARVPLKGGDPRE
jgi:RNA polymerase sigma factor (sigma-70 family)